jgi:hypothetical protein
MFGLVASAWAMSLPRATGAREASCADFGVSVWGFNQKPEWS